MRPRADVTLQIAEIEYRLGSRTETLEELGTLNPHWRIDRLYAKTGVGTRRVAAPEETATGLAEDAARQLLERVDAASLDGLIHVTQSPESTLPTTACVLQERLGLPASLLAFDLIQGCSGFVYGLSVAASLIAHAHPSRILLICTDHYTRYISRHDRTSRPVFGDGAAACIVERGGTGAIGPFVFGTEGAGAPYLTLTPNQGTADVGGPVLFMDGPKVLAFTLRVVPGAVQELLERAALRRDDIDLFVFHQASAVVLDRLRKQIGVAPEKWFQNLDGIGNTVSATIPIALRQAREAGRLRAGMTVLLMGFGVGLSLAGCILRT